jgi:peptide/nickel transport system permease protein
MSKYLLQRLIISIPVFFGVTILVYALYALSPGDPVVNILGVENMSRMSPQQIQVVRHQYGFDQPWYVRYTHWLGSAVRGDLGYPLKGKGTVVANLKERIPPTLLLMGTSFLLALLIGIPMGIVMALRQYSWLDYTLTVTAFANLSVPVFFLGLAAIYVFALKLNVLPTYGMQTIGADFSIADRLKHLVMPAVILAMAYAGQWARYARASMLEVMRVDYVTVARAKGLGEQAVVLRHIFRNALMPLVTMVGLSLPQLLAGAVIVETVFQWPGLGMLSYQATVARDYPMLMGILLVSAVAILLSNILTDISYAIVDPRIRYD